MAISKTYLPAERLVEKRLKITAAQVGRQKFIEACLAVSEEAEIEYRSLWRRMGLSVDWRYTYRSINAPARKTAQLSFLQAYRSGLAYRKLAPVTWCPECRTAIAQAELNDLDRESEFETLDFKLAGGATLAIATTRPEQLAACVAVFVHPQDGRYAALVGQTAAVPLYGQNVPILAGAAADPTKGTGEGMGKISKSRGGGPMPPLKMIQRYSAGAVRYWAASTSTGVEIATAMRRYKSEQNLSLGTELNRVQLAPDSSALASALTGATVDLMSVTRARQIEVAARLSPGLFELPCGDGKVKVGIEV